MKNNKLFAVLTVAFGMVLAGSLGASADTTTYANQAAYTAGTTGNTTLNLDTLNPAGNGWYTTLGAPATLAFAGNQVTISGGGDTYIIGGGYGPCCEVGVTSIFGNRVGSITLTFLNPIYAIAMTAGNGCTTPTSICGYGLDGSISATLSTGDVLTFSGGTGTIPAFLGLSSSNSFTSITLQNVGGSNGAYIEAGNIQVGTGTSTVPEPGSMTLLGTGLVGLAGVIRRKLKP